MSLPGPSRRFLDRARLPLLRVKPTIYDAYDEAFKEEYAKRSHAPKRETNSKGAGRIPRPFCMRP